MKLFGVMDLDILTEPYDEYELELPRREAFMRYAFRCMSEIWIAVCSFAVCPLSLKRRFGVYDVVADQIACYCDVDRGLPPLNTFTETVKMCWYVSSSEYEWPLE